MKTYTYEEILKLVNENGFVLLEDTSVDNQMIHFRDFDGYKYAVSVANFLCKVRNNDFSTLRKVASQNIYTYENMNTYLKINNSDWRVSKNNISYKGANFRVLFENVKTHDKQPRVWKSIVEAIENNRDIVTNTFRTDSDFKKEVFDSTNGEYEVVGKFINVNTRVEMKHNKCKHTFKMFPSSFNNGSRCPYCNCNICETKDEIVEYLKNINNGDYELVGEYINKTTPTLIRHKVCGHEWKIPICYLKYYASCPCCLSSHSSKGERRIYNLLKANNVKFEQQYKFDECKFSKPLPFDFAVFNENYKIVFLVEYQGKHHYEPVRFGGISEEKAMELHKETIIRDKIKSDYCKNNNLFLLKINHAELHDLETILLNTLTKFNLI